MASVSAAPAPVAHGFDTSRQIARANRLRQHRESPSVIAARLGLSTATGDGNAGIAVSNAASVPAAGPSAALAPAPAQSGAAPPVLSIFA
jgi:hypothetical protein